MRHYCLGGCSAPSVCARHSRPVRGVRAGTWCCVSLISPFSSCVFRAACGGPSCPGVPYPRSLVRHSTRCVHSARIGLVAFRVVPTCPLRVCALALPRRPLPPLLGGVACAPRAVPALGAGRAVPRGPCPSVCPAPVPCSVWRAWGGGGPVLVPPYWAWGCGGGGRASPGGVPSTVSRGVWGQALPLSRLPAHWAGCWGPLSTCCGRGCAGVGALLCPLGLHALWGLRAAGQVRGVRVPGGGLGGGGVRRTPRLCGRAGPVGRWVPLPHSVPLPSLGRQQSGCHWCRAVHGGRGPRYHSGSCSHAFSGRDLCGVLARLVRACLFSRPLWEPAARAEGRVALRLLSRAGGGTIPPASGGGGPGPLGLRAGGGGGGGGRAAASLLPFWVAACGTQSWPPSCRRRTPFRRVRAVGVAVAPQGGGGGEGRPVDRSPGGPCRPEPPLCPS